MLWNSNSMLPSSSSGMLANLVGLADNIEANFFGGIAARATICYCCSFSRDENIGERGR